MRSLLMLSSYPAGLCGVSTYTGQLLRRLEPDMPCTSRRLDLRTGALAYAVDAARALAACFRRNGYVHIQYTPTTTGPAAPLLAWAARLRGSAVIVSAHERPSTYERKLPAPARVAFGLFERALFAAAGRVIVFSNIHRAELADRFGVDAEVMPLGMETDVPGERTAPDGVRAAIVTFAGFIRSSKGVEDLIEAAPAIAERIGACHIRIVGAVAERDRGYAATVEALARDAGRQPGCRVTVTTGPDDVEFDRLMRETDLFVFPFRTVSQSITFNRAIAMGTPVVASDIGGVGEIVRSQGVGLVYRAGDAAALADAAARLLSERDTYEGCRDRARAYAALADWRAVATRHRATYLELAAA
jgi:glycosyltransferase involved in cell wall biosynthesis